MASQHVRAYVLVRSIVIKRQTQARLLFVHEASEPCEPADQYHHRHDRWISREPGSHASHSVHVVGLFASAIDMTVDRSCFFREIRCLQIPSEETAVA